MRKIILLYLVTPCVRDFCCRGVKILRYNIKCRFSGFIQQINLSTEVCKQ